MNPILNMKRTRNLSYEEIVSRLKKETGATMTVGYLKQLCLSRPKQRPSESLARAICQAFPEIKYEELRPLKVYAA